MTGIQLIGAALVVFLSLPGLTIGYEVEGESDTENSFGKRGKNYRN